METVIVYSLCGIIASLVLLFGGVIVVLLKVFKDISKLAIIGRSLMAASQPGLHPGVVPQILRETGRLNEQAPREMPITNGPIASPQKGLPFQVSRGAIINQSGIAGSTVVTEVQDAQTKVKG